MTALTRGPLPARVYWRRRLLLMGLALGLVVGTARMLGLGSDASSEPGPQAAQVAAAPTSPTGTADVPTVEVADIPSESRGRAARARDVKRAREPVLADPEGVCSDRDVAVTPSVREPVAGDPVTVTLELRTITTPACTWRVSPATLTMRLTSGDDDIWTSRECPRAVPSEDVVIRNNVGTEVEVDWSGRRSDDECSRLTEWALPGWYHVEAAALAGEPSDLHFRLGKPEPGVVTETVRPRREQTRSRRDDERDADRAGDERDRGQERAVDDEQRVQSRDRRRGQT